MNQIYLHGSDFLRGFKSFWHASASHGTKARSAVPELGAFGEHARAAFPRRFHKLIQPFDGEDDRCRYV